MTDRFKFRAWDKGLKQMVYPDIIYHNINLGCTVYRAFKPSDGDLYFPIQENLIVIQCTGLKDVEGKLIYEGDLVRLLNESNHTKKEYWNPEYIVEHDGWSFSLKHVGGGKSIDCASFNLRHFNQGKIIGNIYETVQE